MASITTRDALNYINNGISIHNFLVRPKLIKAGDVTITNTAGATIAHGLDGYIPMVKCWAEQLPGEITEPVLVAAFTSYHSRYLTVPIFTWYLTSTSFVINPLSFGSSLKVYYRIYAI